MITLIDFEDVDRRTHHYFFDKDSDGRYKYPYVSFGRMQSYWKPPERKLVVLNIELSRYTDRMTELEQVYKAVSWFRAQLPEHEMSLGVYRMVPPFWPGEEIQPVHHAISDFCDFHTFQLYTGISEDESHWESRASNTVLRSRREFDMDYEYAYVNPYYNGTEILMPAEQFRQQLTYLDHILDLTGVIVWVPRSKKNDPEWRSHLEY